MGWKEVGGIACGVHGVRVKGRRGEGSGVWVGKSEVGEEGGGGGGGGIEGGGGGGGGGGGSGILIGDGARLSLGNVHTVSL